MTERPTVAILGVGSMGRAIAVGLVSAGWSKTDLTLLTRHPSGLGDLDATVVSPPMRVDSDVLVVAVKPHQVAAALQPLHPTANRLVLSVAAGVTTAALEALLGEVAVVRAMPNTPALIGEGMSAICPGRHAGDWHMSVARALLEAVGRVVEVDEPLMDAVTAVSGSGPAYLFGLAQWLEEAAVGQGLDPETARSLVTQTLRGAALLLDDSDASPASLRRRVTSPGGTTEAAFEVLERREAGDLWREAIGAATERSRVLGLEEDRDE